MDTANKIVLLTNVFHYYVLYLHFSNSYLPFLLPSDKPTFNLPYIIY